MDLAIKKDCAKIATILGLKRCRKLQIKMDVGSIVTVEAECYVEQKSLRQIGTILKKYELVEKAKEYGMDGDKVPPPNTFVNERDVNKR